MTQHFQTYMGIPIVVSSLVPNGQVWTTNTTVSGSVSSPTLSKPFFDVKNEGAVYTVSYDNHPEANRVKRWFEARSLVVRKDWDDEHRGGYFVQTDKETALLAKLTWGGAA